MGSSLPKRRVLDSRKDEGSSLPKWVLDSRNQGFFTPGMGSSLPKPRVLDSRNGVLDSRIEGFLTPGKGS